MNKRITYFIIGAVFILMVLLPRFQLPDGNFIDWRDGKLLAASLLIGFAIMLTLPGIWMKLFYGVIIISPVMFYSVFSVESYYIITLYMALYSIVYHYFDLKYVDKLMDWICTACVLVCCYVIVQRLGWDKLTNQATICAGTFSNPLFMAGFVAICLPLFFRKGWWLCLPLLFWILMSSRSLTAVLAATGASVLYGLSRTPKALWVPIILSAFFYISGDRDIKNMMSGQSVRIETWKDTLKTQFITKRQDFLLFTKKGYIKRQPFFGYGIGHFKVISSLLHFGDKLIKKDEYNKEAHNEYIQILFELGIIGFIPLFMYTMAIVYRCCSGGHIISISIVAAIIEANGVFIMHSSLALLIVVMLAVEQRISNNL